MYAKYINEKRIERYKGYVIIDGTTYANNEEKAREVGFKDLVIDQEPEFNPETEYLDYKYEEKETTIEQHWIVKPIEPIGEVEDDIE